MDSHARTAAPILLLALAVAVTAAATVAFAAPAVAGEGWAAPVEGCTVILPYGAQYSGRTHRGVDLAADTGTEVASPAAGTVTFAGSVPADGGGTCGAVTIELADGLKVSVLPLGEVFVSAGDSVSAAEAVGTLAGSGDDSYAEAHLHLGVRRGSAYIDPAALLPAREEPEAIPLPASQASGVPAAPALATPPAAHAISPAAAAVGSGVGHQAASSPVISASVPRVALDVVRKPHPVPESAGVPTPSAIAPLRVTGAARGWSLPQLVATGAAVPTVAGVLVTLVVLAIPVLRPDRAKA